MEGHNRPVIAHNARKGDVTIYDTIGKNRINSQQCVQNSTRINFSSVHTYICVCFIRDISNIQQKPACTTS